MGGAGFFPLGVNEKAAVTIHYRRTVVNLGQGGVPVTRTPWGGVVGVMLDGRGRPLQLKRCRTRNRTHEMVQCGGALSRQAGGQGR